jgi:hypothetical protein
MPFSPVCYILCGKNNVLLILYMNMLTDALSGQI